MIRIEPCSLGCPGWAIFNEGDENEGVQKCDACALFASDGDVTDMLSDTRDAQPESDATLYEHARNVILVGQLADLLSHARTLLTDPGATMSEGELIDRIDEALGVAVKP